jgi:hypothetical protein
MTISDLFGRVANALNSLANKMEAADPERKPAAERERVPAVDREAAMRRLGQNMKDLPADPRWTSGEKAQWADITRAMRRAYDEIEIHSRLTYRSGMEALEETIIRACDFLQTIRAKYGQA